MRRLASTSLLLAACSLGCHGDAGHDPPNRPRIGGPVSDFPRADLGEDESPRETTNENEPPPGVVAPPPSEPADELDQGPVATGDGVGHDAEAADAGTSLDAASSLDAGALDVETDAGVETEGGIETDAGVDAAVDVAGDANPASDDASPPADASLPCSDATAQCGDSA